MGTISTKRNQDVRLPGELKRIINNMKLATFDGKNGAGAITLTGATVGQYVLAVACISPGTQVGYDASANFEAQITVADQIQQSASGDLSANDYVAIITSKT
jgi:hypothetical protein